MYKGNEKITICDHPLLKTKIAILRNKETGTNEFRKVVEEVSMMIGYEATKNLETVEVEVETPLEKAMCPVVAGEKPAIIPILRAGLGMVEGFLNLMPTAKVGHIGLARDEETFEPREYYCKLPKKIEDRKIFVVDPMLATGGSAIAALDFVKNYGGKDITFVCIFAAPEGLEKLAEAHPDIDIVVGNLDRELNEKAYILPGVGDAGDRIFGTI
jgi:uracil phosphoribosyltransferase